MRPLYYLITLMLLSTATYAQNTKSATDTSKRKMSTFLTIGDGSGLMISRDSVDEHGKRKHKEEEAFSVSWLSGLDIGFNRIQDKTDYNSTAAKTFLHVSDNLKNSDLFDLRTTKSINVNIWPLIVKYRLINGKNDKMYLKSGLGLQLYNFSFDKPVTYSNNPSPAVVMDSGTYKKNKLAFDYLTIPLELTFKTRIGDSKKWLVYGVGLTGGYLLESWTKQVSSQFGKQKDHDNFNFQNFNSCVTAEIGIDGEISLFASYQLTSLQSYGLNQHPFTIGIRL